MLGGRRGGEDRGYGFGSSYSASVNRLSLQAVALSYGERWLDVVEKRVLEPDGSVTEGVFGRKPVGGLEENNEGTQAQGFREDRTDYSSA